MKGKKNLGKRLLATVAATCGLVSVGTVSAATVNTYSINPTSEDGQAIPGFYPNIEADLVYTSNLLRVPTGEQSDYSFVVAPELLWVRPAGKHLVRLGYQGEYAWHKEMTDDNYYDHFLGADANLDLTNKLDLNLLANYRKDHEPRGGGGTVNQSAEPNTWDEWIVGATMAYGRREAKSQITAHVEHRARDYTNNPATNQFLRNHDDNELALSFYYHLGSKSHLIFEPSFVDMDYTNPASNLDNQVKRLLVGVTWAFAAKTSGELKLGWVSKNYKDPALPDNNGLGVDASINWYPKSYSKVTVGLSRDIYDSHAGGGTTSFEALAANIDWEHKFSKRTRLETGLNYELDEFDTGRSDKILGFYAGLSYEIRRNVRLAARYDYSTRNSDDPTFDFDSHGFVLGVKTTFD